MWRKMVDWHREWENELLGALEQPDTAAQAPAGYRRRMAQRIAERSPVERRQLHAFSQAYRGRRGYWALAKLLLLFSLGAIPLRMLLPGMGWAAAIVCANVFGFLLVLAVFTAWFNYRPLVERRWKLMGRILTYGTATVLVLASVKVWFLDMPLGTVVGDLPRYLGLVLGVGLLALLPQMTVGVLRYRQYELLTAQLQREAEQERLARELSESQLRLLRAQIEPHFLFNTLGAVQQLAQHGAPRAAELTANLIGFLRASLGDMRSEQVSLAAEFGLVESYLKVMQARLGERLRFTLALPRALEHVQLPSMILLTLAENAIKHGIEPALRGGEIAISAAAEGGALRVRVQDSGVGMSSQPGTGAGAGTGLDNVRHRLRLAYGEQAGLALHEADPGLVAEVTIPHLSVQP
jgi:sensor histidine kinase YesM